MTSPRRVVAALGIVGVFATSLALSTGVAAAGQPASPGLATTPRATLTAAGLPAAPITFGLQAAQAKAPDTRPFLSYGVTSGAVVSDHVAVENFGSAPLKLAVYATDAQSTAKGDITFKPASERPTDAGSWLSVAGTGVVTVPARLPSGAPGTVIVPIKLSVPATATPGDHVAAVIASLVTVSTKSRTPIRLDQRVAERAYIRVSGPLRAQLRVEHLQLKFKQPHTPLGKVTAYVTYTVRNTGNVLLATTQNVSVSGLLGSAGHSGALPALSGLLPGAAVTFSTSIAHVTPGLRLSAQVTLHPSPAVQGNVDGKLSPVRSSTAGWAWIALLIAILLPILLVLFLWRRYWYYGPPEDDTTDSVAKKAPAPGKTPSTDKAKPADKAKPTGKSDPASKPEPAKTT
jgi:hypothetical protein